MIRPPHAGSPTGRSCATSWTVSRRLVSTSSRSSRRRRWPLEIRRCIEEDGGYGSAVTHLTYTGRDDLLGALVAAEAFVGDDACLVHAADGLIGLRARAVRRAARVGSQRPAASPASHGREARAPRAGRPAPARHLGAERLEDLSQPGQRLRVRPGCPAAAPAPAARAAPEELDLTGDRRAALRDAGGSLRTKFVRTWRRYCGDPQDLLELNRIVLDQQTPEMEAIDDGDNRIEGRVVIHPTAEVSSSIILGPTIIGPDARVSNSYIGPYTSIGAGRRDRGRRDRALDNRRRGPDHARRRTDRGQHRGPEREDLPGLCATSRDAAARRRRRRARAQLAACSGRASLSRARPGVGARSGGARRGPALDRQQFLLECLTGAMVQSVDRRLGAIHPRWRSRPV